jgi:hypothetical protein
MLAGGEEQAPCVRVVDLGQSGRQAYALVLRDRCARLLSAALARSSLRLVSLAVGRLFLFRALELTSGKDERGWPVGHA